MDDLIISEIEEHEWDSMYDCLYNITNQEYTNQELKDIFKSLPRELKIEALEWGLSDTLWRDHLYEYWCENRM